MILLHGTTRGRAERILQEGPNINFQEPGGPWIYQMSDPSPFPEVIRQVFRPTERGLVGLVNDLLGLCQEVGLELDWRAGQCRVRSIGVEPEEYVEVQLPKSVFRAILAG